MMDLKPQPAKNVKIQKTEEQIDQASRGRTSLLKLLQTAVRFGMHRLIELCTACLACYFNIHLPRAKDEGRTEFEEIMCSNNFLPTRVPLSTKSGLGRILGKWLSQPALRALYELSYLPDEKYLVFDDTQLLSFQQIVLEFMVVEIRTTEDFKEFSEGKQDEFQKVRVDPPDYGDVNIDGLDFSDRDHILVLEFGPFFNEPVPGLSGLASLEELRFGQWFTQNPEDLSNLTSLRVLEFGEKFNQRLPGLSKLVNLEELRFGCDFEQNLEDLSQLKSLRILKFGEYFNQEVKGLSGLTSLEELRFGNYFNQNLEDLSQLKSLRILKFGKNKFGENFNQEVKGLSGLTSLEELRFGYHFNQNLEDLSQLKSLRILKFGKHFNQEVKGLSGLTSLEELKFGHSFNNNDKELEDFSNLTKLTVLVFAEKFNLNISGKLPKSLTELEFGNMFQNGGQLLDLTECCSLETVIFGQNFNQDISNTFCKGVKSMLEYLSLGGSFNNGGQLDKLKSAVSKENQPNLIMIQPLSLSKSIRFN